MEYKGWTCIPPEDPLLSHRHINPMLPKNAKTCAHFGTRSPNLQVVSHPTEVFSQAKVGAQKLQAAKIAGIASERGAEALRKKDNQYTFL